MTRSKQSPSAIAQRLEELRNAEGINREELIKRISKITEGRSDDFLKVSTIVNLEHGRKADMSVTELLLLSIALGINPVALVADIAEPFKPFDEDLLGEVTNLQILQLFSDGQGYINSRRGIKLPKFNFPETKQGQNIGKILSLLLVMLDEYRWFQYSLDVIRGKVTSTYIEIDGEEEVDVTPSKQEQIQKARTEYKQIQKYISDLEDMGVEIPEQFKTLPQELNGSGLDN
jgi:transcriptional regulator with XRE-family HTH domain